MSGPQDWLLATSGIVGAIVVILGFVRMLAPIKRRFQAFFDRLERANDVVLGSPAIPDPNRPGEFLRDAIPDIGVRMTKTETLLDQIIVGVVQDAKDAAQAAARSADEARGHAAASAGRFEELSEQVGDLATRVERWQTHDRVQAETAMGVLAEVGRNTHLTDPHVLAKVRDELGQEA